MNSSVQNIMDQILHIYISLICCVQALERMLNARQLGLKLIANVTYGYTAAHFSGRMPCVEIGDSIVQKGRETLERAIQLVNSTAEWQARVVYGDTDSLFVLLKGASKEEAFRIGKEIVERVTAENPKPVKLKFEKVKLKRSHNLVNTAALYTNNKHPEHLNTHYALKHLAIT